jgi:hypothetical protein
LPTVALPTGVSLEGPLSSHCAFIEMADELNEASLGFLGEHEGA